MAGAQSDDIFIRYNEDIFFPSSPHAELLGKGVCITTGEFSSTALTSEYPSLPGSITGTAAWEENPVGTCGISDVAHCALLCQAVQNCRYFSASVEDHACCYLHQTCTSASAADEFAAYTHHKLPLVQIRPETTLGVMQSLENNHRTPTTIDFVAGAPPLRLSNSSYNTIRISLDGVRDQLVSTQVYEVLLPEGLVYDHAGNPSAQVASSVFCFQMEVITPTVHCELS